MAQILIFGDSIAWGAWDAEGGWVDRLKQKMNKQTIESNCTVFFDVFNLGIPGDTTQSVLERFAAETEKRMFDKDGVTIVFALGVNDSQYILSKKEHFVPLATFEKNLTKLVELARKYTDKIVFVGLTPVDDALVDPIPWLPANAYRNAYVKEYNETLQTFCQKENLHFIPVLEALLAQGYKELLLDGVHPNTEGHEFLFELIVPNIKV